MTVDKLYAPAPGQLEVFKGWVSSDILTTANEFVDQPQFMGFNRGSETSETAGFEISRLPDESLVQLANYVISKVGFEWTSVSAYARRLRREGGSSSVGLHTDDDRSIRTLVEGHKSKWIFGNEPYVSMYPNGLVLEKGDTVVINNNCDKPNLVEHGVEIDNGTSSRVGYLYIFY